MTRKAKKPAKRARKPKAKKPINVVEWEYHAPRKWGFWKRIWVSLFGA